MPRAIKEHQKVHLFFGHFCLANNDRNVWNPVCEVELDDGDDGNGDSVGQANTRQGLTVNIHQDRIPAVHAITTFYGLILSSFLSQSIL